MTFKSFIITAVILISFPMLALAAGSETSRQYVADFYNRYSRNFDELGLVYSVPDYGIDYFKTATTPRELMSLATYYRFRAEGGEQQAQQIIRQALQQSDKLLNQQLPITFSFEDAAAQFLMWQMTTDVPLGLSMGESWGYRQRVIGRAKAGIAAPDTENRAVLSAAYWQYIVNQASLAGMITPVDKFNLDIKIKEKIDKALADNVNTVGWYEEGSPKVFNPHYHLITAFYTMAYGELTYNTGYVDLAKKMAANLRQVSFASGMVEAGLGPRPVGLGAQFYLGAGLLNWRAGYADYGAYLNFAWGDRFFSDASFPNRLEYHATMAEREIGFHDDYAFSNLAELALALPFFNGKQIDFADSLRIPPNSGGIANDGQTIVYKNKKYSLLRNITSVQLLEPEHSAQIKTEVLGSVWNSDLQWKPRIKLLLQSINLF